MSALDTGTDDLLAEVDDGVAVLTMNRPARRNALSPATWSPPSPRSARCWEPQPARRTASPASRPSG